MLRSIRLLTIIASIVANSLSPDLSPASPSTYWAHFAVGPFPVNSPTTVPMGPGSTVRVRVQTGGSLGVNGADLDTIGTAETGLQYDQLDCLAIFNGGGTGSVQTTLTFTDIQVGAAHQRGLLMVGAINALSSPVTLSSTVAGRVQTWTVVGTPFDYTPFNSFPVSWNAGSGVITTTAASGNDSRCIVLDLGPLTSDGDITITLSQHLNDGIVFALGEELAGTLGVSGGPAGTGLSLAAPMPNPARDALTARFTLPVGLHVRLGVYDLTGRRLAELANGEYRAGTHTLNLNLQSVDGGVLPAGLCFLRMETEAGSRVRRLIVVR